MITPYLAAKQGVGAGRVAKISRYRLDGGRCGMVQGRHAEWNWAYRIDVQMVPETRIETVDMGRGLINARRMAATMAATIIETWQGGKVFLRGPNGGLQ